MDEQRLAVQRRLLIVEDDASLRRSLEAVLGEYGYQVVTARDAYEAQGAIDDDAYDLVISDINLPGGGYNLLADCQRREPPLPVILITGKDTPARRRKALDRGAAAYLPKPVRGAQLHRLVRELLAPVADD